MKVERTIAGARAALDAVRRRGERIGFVPTMGALHDGHVSLMARSRATCDVTVVSLFVNPMQFNEPSDLERYPRDEEGDGAIARAAGVDLLFAPPVAELYPAGFATAVEVVGLTEVLEGAVRGPAHFRGVTTVVAKLLNVVQPHVAFFGQKDAQQALVVRRMVRDLDLPVEVEVCPTVREANGLAMSSRNRLLDPRARERAASLHRALMAASRAAAAGERSAERLVAAAAAELTDGGVDTEYVALVDAATLRPVETLAAEALLAIAGRVGGVRLIDNAILRAP